MNKKVMIFDLGGVLVTDGVYPMVKHLVKEFSLDHEEVKKFAIKEFNHMFEGRHSELAFWKKFNKRFGVNTDPKTLERRLNGYYGIKKGTIKLMSALRKNGYNIGFLSNSVKEIIGYLERKYGISKMFDFGVYSHAVKTRKPYQRIFLIAAKKAGVKPEEIIFIDDKREYLKGAKAIGMKTVLFASSTQTAKALRKMGVDA